MLKACRFGGGLVIAATRSWEVTKMCCDFVFLSERKSLLCSRPVSFCWNKRNPIYKKTWAKKWVGLESRNSSLEE